MAEQILSTRSIHKRWGEFLELTIRLPDGTTVSREVEDHGPAAAVLPFDPGRRRALLARQFRAPVFYKDGVREVLEAPAGRLEGDEPAVCARREALEEVGVRLEAVDHVATVWAMPGVSTERISLFLAQYDEASRVEAGGGLADEHEHITVVELALADLARMCDRGEILDLKTLALVQALRLRRPALFA